MAESAKRRNPALKSGGRKQTGNTRDKIINAALRIVTRDGMRGVRHRAVAQEAGVPLGSTTYYFKSIDDLISTAFEYWREKADSIRSSFAQELGGIAARYDSDDNYDMQQAVTDVYRSVHAYLLDQIDAGKDDRVIELAFYHEALHCERLRSLVERYWASELAGLRMLHEFFGSADPQADAELSLALIHQIERFSVVEHNLKASRQRLDTTLKHYFEMTFQVSIS
ncbi:TetR family transcriptional regulator [Exilibacterium tricleocarpae]|uniref:TetR family transcriptional regulator n=1 Tax=Exilibacterium tricleocarpae TaxID=2591008 RepID=A0A545TVA3_9GAMM|nr:TetR family transcriptional regulator [Exilibacterium tricleocarpae]TQV81143.1 TetR family transcriptional regulator [Exilibacterium tricleocarpae]